MNNVEKLVEALVSEVQELDEVAIDLFENFTLDNATGVNLDVFGVIVGRGRTGETDDVYRDILRARIRNNLGGGTIEDILTVLTLVFGSSLPMSLTEGAPAEFEVEILVSIPAAKALSMAQAVGRGKAGGVKANLKFFDATPVFAYDGANGGSKYDGGFKYSSSFDTGSVI